MGKIIGALCEEPLIDGFNGDYAFLRNDFKCDIQIGIFHFTNAEAAYQAHKNIDRAHEFEKLDAIKAHNLGQQVVLTEHWNEAKTAVMYEVLKAKFTNKLLRFWLKQTNRAILINSCNYDDHFWGVYKLQGKNMLGAVLMQIRDEINDEDAKKG